MKPFRKSDVAQKPAVEVLQVPALAQFSWLVHGFSTRQGGVSALTSSSGPAKGAGDLNLGIAPWDRAANVVENRRRLLASLQGQRMRLVILNQIHSDLIQVFDGNFPTTQVLRGDGLVTDRPGLLLSIQAADCFPILLADTRQRVVAALHCGWRGTARRLAQKAVGRMRLRYGSRVQDVRVAIGPGIRGCCYRVGVEVAEEFTSQFLYAEHILISRKDERGLLEKRYPLLFRSGPRGAPQKETRSIHLDLVQANVRQLMDAGIAPQHISAEMPCTSCHSESFFSHRRDAGRTGRMMGVIGIRP